METPCVILAYNRPELLTKILLVLKNNKIKLLEIFVDGPREDKDNDQVNQCRKLCEEIDWTEKKLHFHILNRGLSGIANDLDYISNLYDQFIVLEEDCLPLDGFFPFTQKALEIYKNNNSVFGISGYQILNKNVFENYTYFAVGTFRFTCWGWATWSAKWKEIKNYRSNYSNLFDKLSNVPDSGGYDLKKAAILVSENKLQSWAVPVAIAMLYAKKTMIVPVEGLISNIGFDSGEHSNKNETFFNKNINGHHSDIILWPDSTIPEKKFVRELNKFFLLKEFQKLGRKNKFLFLLKNFKKIF